MCPLSASPPEILFGLFTELGVSEAAAEIPDDEIDFVLDRPFLFLVTGQDGSILFSGVVRNIAET